MPIQNVSTLYQRINKGSEGGGEFSRLMNLLLTAEAKEEGWKIEPYSDASGDYLGMDAHVGDRIIEGYHFKFYPSPISTSHKSSIQNTIKKTIERSPGNVVTLNIVTPEDLMKEDMAWFEQLKRECKNVDREFEGAYFAGGLKLVHWGHTRIVEMALRHPHIGKHYFPELFSYEVNLVKIAAITIDEENFIFDFSFTNDSTTTYLLQKIELVRLEVYEGMGSLGEEYYLKSWEPGV